eukprot:g2947.t1
MNLLLTVNGLLIFLWSLDFADQCKAEEIFRVHQGRNVLFSTVDSTKSSWLSDVRQFCRVHALDSVIQSEIVNTVVHRRNDFHFGLNTTIVGVKKTPNFIIVSPVEGQVVEHPHVELKLALSHLTESDFGENARYFFKVSANDGIHDPWISDYPENMKVIVTEGTHLIKVQLYDRLSSDIVANASVLFHYTVPDAFSTLRLRPPMIEGYYHIRNRQFDFSTNYRLHSTEKTVHVVGPSDPEFPQTKIKIVVVSNLAKYDGIKHVIMQMLKGIPKIGNHTLFTIKYLDLSCAPEKEDPVTVAEILGAGIPLHRECLHIPEKLLSRLQQNEASPPNHKLILEKLTLELRNAKSVLSLSTDVREAVEPILVHLRGMDVFFTVNGEDEGDNYIYELARLAQIRSIVSEMGGSFTLPHGARPNAVVMPSHYARSKSNLPEGVPGYVVPPPMIVREFPLKSTISILSKYSALQDACGVRFLETLVGKSAKLIGVVGRTDPEKFPGLFLQAAQYLLNIFDDISFVWIGTGKLEEGLRELTRSWALFDDCNFCWTGFIHPSKIASLMANLDLLVLPSIASSETFGIVSVEALAMGIPIMNYGTGGTLEYTRSNWNGIIVNSSSSLNVVDDLITALRDFHLNETFAWMQEPAIIAAGRNIVIDNFSEQKMAQRYASLFLDSISNSTRTLRSVKDRRRLLKVKFTIDQHAEYLIWSDNAYSSNVSESSLQRNRNLALALQRKCYALEFNKDDCKTFLNHALEHRSKSRAMLLQETDDPHPPEMIRQEMNHLVRYHNTALNAHNVFEIDLEPAIVDDVYQYYLDYIQQYTEPSFDLSYINEANRTQSSFHFYISHVTHWNSDIKWISTNNIPTFDSLATFFKRFGMDKIFAERGLVDFVDSITVYQVFFVVRSFCKSRDFHVDFQPGTGVNAYTALIPLRESNINLAYLDLDGNIQEYRYKPGKSIIFGEGFLHSTNIGVEEDQIPVFCINFGTDNASFIPAIMRTLATQVLFVFFIAIVTPVTNAVPQHEHELSYFQQGALIASSGVSEAGTSLSVSKSTVSELEPITVTVTRNPQHRGVGDFVAAYAADDDVGAVAPVRVVIISHLHPEYTATTQSGVQRSLTKEQFSMTFKLVNIRSDYKFVFFNATVLPYYCEYELPAPTAQCPHYAREQYEWYKAEELASSSTITFKGKENVGKIRVLPTTQGPEYIRVMWSSSVPSTTARPFLQYASSKSDLISIESCSEKESTATVTCVTDGTASAYTKDELCGAPANAWGWRDPGTINEIIVGPLRSNEVIYFRVGDATQTETVSPSFSAPQKFTMHRYDVTQSVTLSEKRNGSKDTFFFDKRALAIFGDLGRGTYDDSQTWYAYGRPSVNTSKYLGEDVDQDRVGSIFHIGDISYAIGFRSVWDDYLYMIGEKFSAKVPYTTNLGNHEMDQSASAAWPVGRTKSFFSINDSGGECGVPAMRILNTKRGSIDEPWYSYDVNGIHVVSICTECDFAKGSKQWSWIEGDLASVDRTKTPWVIMGGHRPALIDSPYDTNPTYHTGDQEVSRLMLSAFEPLWVKYNVAMCFWGHHHTYQRMCAFKNGKCVERSKQMDSGDNEVSHIYSNTSRSAPIHIVIGTAGASFSNFQNNTPAYVEHEAKRYGYGRLTPLNSTHLFWEMQDVTTGEITDRIYVVQKYVGNPSGDTTMRAVLWSIIGIISMFIFGTIVYIIFTLDPRNVGSKLMRRSRSSRGSFSRLVERESESNPEVV